MKKLKKKTYNSRNNFLSWIDFLNTNDVITKIESFETVFLT